MANNADPDQLASSVCKCGVYPGSAGPGLTIQKVSILFDRVTTSPECEFISLKLCSIDLVKKTGVNIWVLT